MHEGRVLPLLAALGLLCSLAGGCLEDEPCVCSTDFRTIVLEVVNETGAGEADVRVTTTLVRTGETISPPYAAPDPASYTIITDGEKDMIRPVLGDRLRVTGEKDVRRFQTEFLIVVGECRCHVDKASGPDRVVLH